MAMFGSGDDDGAAGAKGYDPYHLSSPQVSLIYMLIFLAIAAFVATALYRQISTAFFTNPGLNGLILGVLVVGIFLSFNQVVRLVREVRWVNSFRFGDGDAVEPCVLAGPTCDSADVLYEKTPYPLPVSLTIGDEVLIEGTGAYTTTYSAVAFNGFEPLRSYVI